MKQFFVVIVFLNFSFLLYNQELSLISPKFNSVQDIGTINFLWNKAKAPNSLYKIQVSDDYSFNNLIVDSLILSNEISLDLSNNVNTHLLWRVKDSLTNTFSESRSLYIIDLQLYSNLKVWLKSDSVVLDNGNVSEWKNLASSNYINFEQVDPVKQPSFVLNSFAGYPSVQFNGGDQLEGDENFFTNIGLETYFVVKPSSTSSSQVLSIVSDQGLLNTHGSGLLVSDVSVRTYMPFAYAGGSIHTISNSTSNFLSLNRTIDFGANVNRISVNQSIDTSFTFGLNLFNTSSINPSYKYTIGGQARSYNATRTFKGDMYEMILLNDTVFQTEQDRAVIPNYLHQKYSPYPNLGEDEISNYKLCDTEFTFSVGNHYNYQSWSGGSVDTFLNVNKSGEYFVEVNDVFGYNLTDTVLVEFPYTNFLDTTIVCVGDTALLYKGIGSDYTFSWSNGSSDSMLYVINSGLYSVTVTDTFGCSIADETYVLIDSFSFLPTLGADRNFCLNTELVLENIDDDVQPVTYNWSTGENTPSIFLSYPSDTSIVIEAIDKYACVLRDTIQALINNVLAPNVDFISDTACINTSSTLTSISIANGADEISSFTWTFPDFSTDNSAVVNSYTHNGVDSFEVKLTVETDSNCTNSFTKSVYLRSLPNPNFSYNILCAQDSAGFIDQSTFIGVDSVVSWSWLSENNSMSSLQNPNLFFADDSMVDLKLIVEDIYGCSDSITKQIEVFPALTADFSYINNCIGDSISFKDETQSLSVVDWNWIFNGFNSSSLQNPKFQYNTVGMQTVSLEIENALGCKSSVSKNIEISPQPIASFNFNKACLEDTTLFFDNSVVLSDSIIVNTYKIEQELFTEEKVSYVFEEESNYNVYYSIETKNGCFDDTLVSVKINPLPNPVFDFTPDYGTAPLEVSFLNETTDATNYVWEFGDNENSLDVNPQHTYIENGIYNVTLSAINEFGCENVRTEEIAVIPSDLDLELKNLSLDVSQNGNSSIVNASVLLTNVGTRAISNADLILRLDNGDVLAQKWTGDLGIGQIIDYDFDSYFIVSDISTAKYVCVEAIEVNDGTELNLNNNKICKLIDGSIQFSKPYPNPVNNFVNLDVVTNDKGICNVMVVNMLGDILETRADVELQKGYNQLQVETAKYQSGKYFLKVTFLEEEYLYSFVVK